MHTTVYMQFDKSSPFGATNWPDHRGFHQVFEKVHRKTKQAYEDLFR